MKTILLADDDGDFRSVLRNILTDKGYSVLEAADGSRALELFKSYFPDLAIVDLQMPGLDGFQLTKEIRILNSHIPIIILTGHGDIPRAVSATKLGAQEFLEKPPDFDVLLDIVKSALDRQTDELLSCRELAVLNLVKEGKTNRDISSILKITMNTVCTYLGRVLMKLDAETRAQAVAIAIQKGLISADTSPRTKDKHVGS